MRCNLQKSFVGFPFGMIKKLWEMESDDGHMALGMYLIIGNHTLKTAIQDFLAIQWLRHCASSAGGRS